MWLFSASGFWSVVAVPGEPDVLLVRARLFKDAMSFGELASAEVRETDGPGSEFLVGVVSATPERDYPYRLRVGRTIVARVASRIVSEIQYSNFKDRVSADGEYGRSAAYSRVWSAMHSMTADVERPRERGTVGVDLYDREGV